MFSFLVTLFVILALVTKTTFSFDRCEDPSPINYFAVYAVYEDWCKANCPTQDCPSLKVYCCQKSPPTLVGPILGRQVVRPMDLAQYYNVESWKECGKQTIAIDSNSWTWNRVSKVCTVYKANFNLYTDVCDSADSEDQTGIVEGTPSPGGAVMWSLGPESCDNNGCGIAEYPLIFRGSPPSPQGNVCPRYVKTLVDISKCGSNCRPSFDDEGNDKWIGGAAYKDRPWPIKYEKYEGDWYANLQIDIQDLNIDGMPSEFKVEVLFPGQANPTVYLAPTAGDFSFVATVPSGGYKEVTIITLVPNRMESRIRFGVSDEPGYFKMRVREVEKVPSNELTQAPTNKPTQAPTNKPTQAPTNKPTQAPTNTPIQTPIQAPTLPSPPTGPCQTAWGQCGGNGYSGPTCCGTGLVCVTSSVWWAQCKPA